MRTVAALYSGLGNFGTYAGAASANATYADLAVDTVFDGSASGSVASSGAVAGRAVVRVTGSGVVASAGACDAVAVVRVAGSGSSTSAGSVTNVATFRPTVTGEASSGGNTSGGVRWRASADSATRVTATYSDLAGRYATYAAAGVAVQVYADLGWVKTYPITSAGT